MEMKIVGVVLAAFVSLVVLASVLVPVLDDATDTDDMFTNTGSGQYRLIKSDESYSLVWNPSTPTKLTINDTEVNGVPGNDLLAMGDFTVRIQPSSSGYAQYVATDDVGLTVNASDNKTFTLTYEDGTITVTNGTTTKTRDTDGFYALVPENGTHTMKATNATAYLNATDPLLVIGLTQVGTQWNTGYMVDGTITDYDVEQWTGTTSYTPSNIADDSTKVDGYVDLYTIKAFTWTVDNNGTTQNVTYSYFLVPIEVTAEKAEHLTNGQIELLEVIPVLIIVAILLAVVALVVRSKLE